MDVPSGPPRIQFAQTLSTHDGEGADLIVTLYDRYDVRRYRIAGGRIDKGLINDSDDVAHEIEFLRAYTGIPSLEPHQTQMEISLERCLSSRPLLPDPIVALRLVRDGWDPIQRPLVVVALKGHYFILEGRHRAVAWQLQGHQVMQAIVFSLPSKTVKVLRDKIAIDRRDGRRLTPLNEVVDAMIQWVESYGKNVKGT